MVRETKLKTKLQTERLHERASGRVPWLGRVSLQACGLALALIQLPPTHPVVPATFPLLAPPAFPKDLFARLIRTT